MKISAKDRFDKYWKQDSKSSCHLWTGGLGAGNYPTFSYKGGAVYARRWIYEFNYGPIANGRILHNWCGKKNCVNPEHMDVTGYSALFSTEAHKQKRKPYCPNGHPYDDNNLASIHKGRHCKICRRERQRRYRAKHPRPKNGHHASVIHPQVASGNADMPTKSVGYDLFTKT